MNAQIAVIGGGASGLIAAVAAARNGARNVVVLERLSRPGKKLLATGNGRGNFTNASIGLANYHGKDPSFTLFPLSVFSGTDAVSFFSALGIHPRTEADGKIFPYSGQASALLDALRSELARHSVPVETEFDVSAVTRTDSGFHLSAADGRTITADRLIVAAGGRASPALGSDGSGFALLTSLGHRITPIFPALVKVRVSEPEVRGLSGIKVQTILSAYPNGERSASLSGEVLFTDNGLSGPPVLQLTALYPDSYPYVVSLDLMPEFQEGDVLALLRRRREELSHLDMTAFFSGLFHKRVGNVIAKRSGVERLSLPIRDLGDEHLTRMAEVVKSFQFTATAPQGFSQAQVTVGGADTDEFDEKTMESKKVPGLYVSGELYDIHGDCGGYNLQWAWASGYLAGTSAALSLANAAPKLEERL